MTGVRPERWVLRPPGATAHDDRTPRLFCFHGAGGAASAFRGWRGGLGEVQVWPVQLPGRENRFGEAPLTTVRALVEALAEGLGPWLGARFAFYGHSFGALLAFELARRLSHAAGAGPAHLFVAACPAPHLPRSGPWLHREPDAALIDELRRQGATPEPVLGDAELMALVLGPLRADYAAAETYDYEPGPRLRCALTAFCGRDDLDVGVPEVDAWRTQTAGRFELEVLEGGHFLTPEGDARVRRRVVEELRRGGVSEQGRTS